MRWLRRPSSHQQRHIDPVDSFAHPARRSQLDRIYQHTTLPLSSFDQLYVKPLKRYAALVHRLPAHDERYVYPEVQLDQSLALIERGLKLRRSRLLPSGAAPEDQAQQAEVWSVALVYAALLTELNRHAMTRPNGSEDGYAQLLDRDILDWLQTFPKIWNQLTAVAAGLLHLAGTLGELIGETHRALEERGRRLEAPQDAPAEPAKHPDKIIQRESQGQDFLNWLRNLIAHQRLPVNQAGAMVHVIEGKAFLRSPALFQRYCQDRQKESPQGEINDLDWRTIQRSFEALHSHRKRPDGKSLWTLELAWPGHPTRRLSGYLVEKDSVFEQCIPNTPQGPNGQAIARV